MVQSSGRAEDGQSGGGRDAGSLSHGNKNADAAETETAGASEAADNEGFRSGPQVSDEPESGGGSSSGGSSGGPEDPPEEDQSPSGEQDPEQNPPLPRTWN
jgi:hypothetical protein